MARLVYESNTNNEPKTFMNISDSEVQDFLKSLYDNSVQYMLVGGMATVFHGHIRTTQDLDLWVKENPDNKKNLVKALEQSGVSGASHYEKVQMVPGWSSIKIGESGFEADFMSHLNSFSEEDFDECYKRAKRAEFDGIPITVIHIKDLISEKKKTRRHKDLDDVENLEALLNKNKPKNA